MIRNRFTRLLIRLITFLVPGKQYDKAHELIQILDSNINEVAEKLINEMDEADIIMSTPLMMDLELASFKEVPEIPFRWQVKYISDIALAFPGRIMPFIMFDPRRRSIMEMAIKALEEMGFLGIKMYPPLGYHPDPGSFFNEDDANARLNDIYAYCQNNEVPITAHCSRVAAYSGDFMRTKEMVIDFCKPSNWIGVLNKFPKLYLNLAHFGGDEEFLKLKNPSSWGGVIIELMKKYEHVYADTSYHNVALQKRTSTEYFKILNKMLEDDIVRERILFGTDWPMARYTWKQISYVEAMKKLPLDMFEQITYANPLSFLFPERRLPHRIMAFYETNGIDAGKLPKWIIDSLAP